MSRFHSHINTAEKIIRLYNGSLPFALFIKDFFSKDRKYGSRDRKIITHYCYIFFRVAKAFSHMSFEEILIRGLFLIETEASYPCPEEWVPHTRVSVAEKMNRLGLHPLSLFPSHNLLSASIDKEVFALSLLQQPDLFLRIRRGQEETVMRKMKDSGLAFTDCGEHCLRLAQGFSVDDFFELDREVVIQDISSQKVLNVLSSNMSVFQSEPLHVWDCCSGSGGKSLLIQDLWSRDMKLTVTDVRKSILNNLSQRFRRAGIQPHMLKVVDLENEHPFHEFFDVIICDVPCTGSGTWARTPESSFYFNPSDLPEYSQRQRKIISNALPGLKVGGIFIYITCSVFAEENEAVVNDLIMGAELDCIHSEYITGYGQRADSLFVAVSRKKSGSDEFS